MYNFKAPRT